MSIIPTSVVWLACASREARRRSSQGLTSTRQWIADSGSPRGFPSSIGWSGSHSSAFGSPAAFAASARRRTASRFIVDSSTSGGAGPAGTPVQHGVHLDVVGVPVAAVPVVADGDVGALLVEQAANLAAASSTGAAAKARSCEFCSQPLIPESA